MEDVRAPFAGFLTAQNLSVKSIDAEQLIRLNLRLLDGFIKSIVQLIVSDELPNEEELMLYDLLDNLEKERGLAEAKLPKSVEDQDPLIGWYLHQRSQSGFELKS